MVGINGTIDLEAALVRCGEGDRKALRLLYDHEAGRMIAVAQRMLKRRALAEEAVHDSFISIWNTASRYDPARGAARSWMYTILRNRTLNILRGEARSELTADFDAFEQESLEDTPEEIISKLSEANALRRCLERLDASRRRLVLMAYAHGLSHGELAARLDVPLGTVKSWLRRSLLSLRECLQ
ncbi:MAG: sigma-70 family RNA polymerase sigma factor [Beijerinckiaceae bacterium]|nr:sigma-70 family RNA polymerase sigma factor [Beijerinckiaceae bacterium]